MLGIIVQLVISYFLLKYFVKQDIEALGLKPNQLRIIQLFLGILWALTYYCLYEFLLGTIVHNPYKINPSYTLVDFMNSVVYLLRTVGYEELMFRGAIFYILIEKIGAQKAVVISACTFGIYHWFTWQVFGNPVQMILVFLTTASGGFLFAMAYRRTGSMYLQFGLHFGCDLATMVIFSKNKTIGLQWLVKSFASDPIVPPAIISVPVLIIHFIGFQLLTYWMLRKIPLMDRKK
jgi:membrane protease YdiL (CAAX protease family)